jgi:competence protein ComEC
LLAEPQTQPLSVTFWDVGQANCSTISLPNGRLIIIDTGNRGSPLVDWLSDRRQIIDAVVITHNDSDHVGSLPALIDQFEARIGKAYLLIHQSDYAEKGKKLFRRLRLAEERGLEVSRLETGQTIWEEKGLQAALRVVHPSMLENFHAGSPNRTSGILCLEIAGKVEVIWPGDAPLSTLRKHCSNSKPNYLVGPHHGAPEDYRSKAGHKAIKAVKPNSDYISVSTKNRYNHPRPKFIRRLEMEGCKVVCSQMTVHCDRRQVLQKRKPLMQSHAILGLRPPRNRGITCRGPLRLDWDGSKFVQDQLAQEHLKRIGLLKRAQCLKGRNNEWL